MSDDWIAVDWGTSRLRVWRMMGDRVIASASSDQGMGTLSRDGFEPALLGLIDGWLGAGVTQVIACGMVGARQGWVEAPYASVPVVPLGIAACAPVRDPRLRVSVIAGLKQMQPADVMRGEETQIAGFMALHPGWDGVICLPGTHTKWAQISAGEVVSFQTFMTGEMFALLGRDSVLRHSVSKDGWDAAAFDTAVSATLSRPEALAARLFGLRAGGLVTAPDADAPVRARSALSGLLIGAELAAARPYWLGTDVAIVGGAGQSAAYAAALGAQGVSCRQIDAQQATLAGLVAAYSRTKDMP